MSKATIGLSEQHCGSRVSKLTDKEVHDLLQSLAGWSLTDQAIEKAFGFKNYYETMAFVNAVGWIAHREDHHPDLVVSYNKCVVRYSTHSVGGVSENDFICAAKVETLSQ